MAKNDGEKKTVLFEDFFTSMLNSITESAFLIDLDGVVLAANDMMGRRMGFSRGEDLVGKDIFGLLPPEVAAIRRARAEEVVSTGEPVQFEDERSGRYFFPTLSVWIWETAWLWDFSFRELAFCHYEGTIRLEAG